MGLGLELSRIKNTLLAQKEKETGDFKTSMKDVEATLERFLEEDRRRPRQAPVQEYDADNQRGRGEETRGT